MLTTIFFLIILLYSIIFHEVAHGYAAYRNGDMTAYNAGRLTLNPFSHLDLFGSVIVPFVSYYMFKTPFGWAKPVPYNPNNLNRNNKYAELEVASAGVLTNIFIGFLAVIIFHILRLFGLASIGVTTILQMVTSINLFLAAFNLLPFPPADGFSIFSEIFFKKDRFIFFSHKIKAFFSNPATMIIVIFVAVQVFKILVPYILSFIDYLY